MHPSVFICYSKALMTGISLPMEMIDAANSIDRIKNHRHKTWKCHVVSAQQTKNQPMELTKGLRVVPAFDINNSPDPRCIFLPSIWGNPEVVVKQCGALIEWLKVQHAKGAKICATGTAVCLLAESGLLDHKQATTHWYYFERFQQKYPKVKIQKHHFITQEKHLYCTASMNALVELTLYFIEQSYGKEVSQIIEQQFNHEVNKNYERPWLDPSITSHPDEEIIEVQQWMKSNIHQGINVKELSQMAHMSVRNFTRRFKNATGKSALTYSIELKMQVARELLKETNLSQQSISEQIGFKETSYFARIFKQQNDLTPTAYRKMVRRKLFSLKGYD